MPDVDLDGVKIHYVQAGVADPPIIFVHGWCCDHTFFQPQFEHFARRHAVIALDLRGCGQSDRPERGYDIPTLTDDVAGLCRALGLQRPIVVGHSLGGMIGVELNARHPSLPRAIVAVDPGPISPLPETRAMFESFITQLDGPDAAAVRRTFIEDMFEAADDKDRRERIIETMLGVPLSVAIDVLRGVLAWNGVGALRLRSVPLLVLLSAPGGSNDPSRLSALDNGVQVGITVGAGHFHQLDVPEQVTPMIERFISTLT